MQDTSDINTKWHESFNKTMKGASVVNLAFLDGIYNYARIAQRFGGFIRPAEDFIKVYYECIEDHKTMYSLLENSNNDLCPILWGIYGCPIRKKKEDASVFIHHQGQRLNPFKLLSHNVLTGKEERTQISNIAFMINYIFTILLGQGLIYIDTTRFNEDFKATSSPGKVEPKCLSVTAKSKKNNDDTFQSITTGKYKTLLLLQFKFNKTFFEEYDEELSVMDITIKQDLLSLKLDIFKLVSLLVNGDADPEESTISEKSFICRSKNDIKQLLWIIHVAETATLKKKPRRSLLPNIEHWTYWMENFGSHPIHDDTKWLTLEYIFASFIIIQDMQWGKTKEAKYFTRSALKDIGDQFKDNTRFARRDRTKAYTYKDIHEWGPDYRESLKKCAWDRVITDIHYKYWNPDLWSRNDLSVNLPEGVPFILKEGEDPDDPEVKELKRNNLYLEYAKMNNVTSLQNLLQLEDDQERLAKVERVMYAKLVMATANYHKEIFECKMMKTLATDERLRNRDTVRRNNWSKGNLVKSFYKKGQHNMFPMPFVKKDKSG